jgi:hypothetical protein
MLLVINGEPGRGADAEWELDRTVTPAALPPQVSILEARADGEVVDLAGWPLAHTPGEERPSIEITLKSDDDTMTIFLDPYAVAPRILELQGLGAIDRVSVDLDSAGLAREDW